MWALVVALRLWVTLFTSEIAETLVSFLQHGGTTRPQDGDDNRSTQDHRAAYNDDN